MLRQRDYRGQPMPNYVRGERFLLKGHPEFSERWLQDRIAEDPKILGLGDLVLRDRERSQPRAGRLDLLMQDVEAERRYEIELQLGSTDEAHIIRTIEYWDVERKRYPQYDHCAVLIAEDVTSRFLNVVSLFNGSIPLIAIQLTALRVAEYVTLAFTTVLNELTRGPVGEDEEAEASPTDRTYWQDRAGAQLALADRLLEFIHTFAPGYQLKYNKFYIGLSLNGNPDNFVVFRPQQRGIRIEPRLPPTDEITKMIANAGFDDLGYSVRWGRYRIRLNADDLTNQRPAVVELLQTAYQNRHE